MWYQITRYSQAFRGLICDQRAPRFWVFTLIIGSDDKMITSTKNVLNSRFDMKYL